MIAKYTFSCSQESNDHLVMTIRDSDEEVQFQARVAGRPELTIFLSPSEAIQVARLLAKKHKFDLVEEPSK